MILTFSFFRSQLIYTLFDIILFLGEVSVICEFDKSKAFTGARVLITLSVSKCFKGQVIQKQLILGHELTWGNRFKDDTLTASTKVDIVYETTLEVTPVDGYVVEGSTFTKYRNEIDYGIKINNAGTSDIENLAVDFYVPHDLQMFMPLLQTKV